jgi:hypothetical protein
LIPGLPTLGASDDVGALPAGVEVDGADCPDEGEAPAVEEREPDARQRGSSGTINFATG